MKSKQTLLMTINYFWNLSFISAPEYWGREDYWFILSTSLVSSQDEYAYFRVNYIDLCGYSPRAWTLGQETIILGIFIFINDAIFQ
jgi:hypothetical protein